MTRIGSLIALALCGFTCTTTATAAEWGDLTMRFAYDGAAPEPAPIAVTKDPEFCGKQNLVDEALVVNPKNGGLANVIVYLYLGRGDKKPPVHESYAQDAKPEMDNKGCRFAPRVVTVKTGDSLLVRNSDQVGHNIKIDTFTNPPSNVTIPSGRDLKQQFSAPERLPVRVGCSIHPWMSGWLVVQDNPYMAVSDADGNLTIKNLPVGKWTFQLWQEKAGYLDEAKVNGKLEKWKRGRAEIEIKPGANNFGELKIAPSMFKD